MFAAGGTAPDGRRVRPGFLGGRLAARSCGVVSGVVRRAAEPHASAAASARAFMCAVASIETIGLTPGAVGNAEPSQT